MTRRFILHWGEMGTRWGVNRTVAQVHALLYLAPRPLNADDIVAALEVARSNVSTSLKELQGWGIVRVVHVHGDRRDHFESLHEVWELFRVIMEERKKREFDPTLALLRECAAEARKTREAPVVVERREALEGMLRAVASTYDALRALPGQTAVAWMGGKLAKLLAAARS